MKVLLAIFTGFAIGFVVFGTANLVQSAALATPMPLPMVCFLGDDRYVLQLFTEATPTRISAPTVTPTPAATQPACQVRTVVNPVNVRSGPGASFVLVGPNLKAGTVVQVAEWRTVGTGLWGRLCAKVNGQDVWFSASSAGVKQ